MRVRVYFMAVVPLAFLPLTATGQDTFNSFRNQFESDLAAYQNIVETGVAASETEYLAYQEQMQQEFEEFRNEMEQLWGSFQERTQRNWVEYTDGGRTKVHVDFETGEGSVEILVDDPEQVPEARDEIDDKLLTALDSRATELGFDSDKFPNQPVTEEPVLQDQLDKESGESNQEYASRTAENNLSTREIQGEDGVIRTVITVNFKLAPNHIQTRAQKVADHVYRYAAVYNLAPPLVFAVIHTESFFNPTAASHANAYGLMQLVPTSGGADAYRAVFKKDGIPTKSFLFKPENNVNLGCAYLDILNNRYFRSVNTDLTRQYLSIAAYNTGAGNVARSYTGNTSVNKALGKINGMSDQQNFDHLVENLPYEETRNYLRKIVERAKLYEGWSKTR